MWKRLFKKTQAPAQPPIIIVSGLPRSGTSMMMQMLAAGGIDLVTDNIRQADTDNPQGYFEFEQVKRLKEDATWLDTAHGKAVKVIASLLPDLPPTKSYKILFMQRPMDEVLASQRAMMQRRHTTTDGPNDAHMAAMFTKHLQTIHAWIRAQPHLEVLYVQHRAVLDSPREQAERIQGFLGSTLAIEPMVAVVDDALYRNRA